MSSRKQASRGSPVDVGGEGSVNAFQEIMKTGVDGGKSLYSLQVEFAHKALREEMDRLQALLEGLTDGGVTAAQWMSVSESRLGGLVDLMHKWQEITSQTFVEMNRLMGASLSVPGFGARMTGTTENGEIVERRVSARVISFPDRRTDADSEASEDVAMAHAKKRRKA